MSGDHASSASAVSNTPGDIVSQNGYYDSTGTYQDNKETFKQDSVTDSDTYKNRQDVEVGYNSSPYTQYKEYVETLRNIEEMIIDELRDCFMLVY